MVIVACIRCLANNDDSPSPQTFSRLKDHRTRNISIQTMALPWKKKTSSTPGPSSARGSSHRATTPPNTRSVPELPQSTPIKNRATSMNTYSSLHYERDFRMRKLGAEMDGKFIGPMPVHQFLDTFLPCPGHVTLDGRQTKLLDDASRQKKEDLMYDPLVRLCPLRSHSIIDRRRK